MVQNNYVCNQEILFASYNDGGKQWSMLLNRWKMTTWWRTWRWNLQSSKHRTGAKLVCNQQPGEPKHGLRRSTMVSSPKKTTSKSGCVQWQPEISLVQFPIVTGGPHEPLEWFRRIAPSGILSSLRSKTFQSKRQRNLEVHGLETAWVFWVVHSNFDVIRIH